MFLWSGSIKIKEFGGRNLYETSSTESYEVISFTELGRKGRLGNQLFQYAFLRSCAEKLGVQYLCPEWEGDSIFDLNEHGQRIVGSSAGLPQWCPPDSNFGWIDGWAPIDGVDYCGYFESSKFYRSESDVRRWFTFREQVLQQAIESLPGFPVHDAVGVHLRFGDYRYYADFYNPKRSYYSEAIRILCPGATPVLVFSDEPDRAMQLMSGLGREIHCVRGNSAAVDLALMSMCSAIVCAASTFSWWGAFLCGGEVVCPSQGLLRPGSKACALDPWPD
jgi:hypothetical protein